MRDRVRRSVLAAIITLVAACADSVPVTAPAVGTSHLMATECDVNAITCEDPGSGGTIFPGIALGFSNLYCRSVVTNTQDDVDGDGLSDECGYQLAFAFRPLLVQGAEGWGAPNPPVPGEYIFAVGPSPGSAGIRIAYMPAYYHDLGRVPDHYMAHTGDAEFIIVEVVYDGGTGRWKTSAIFLSNHCGAVDPVLGFFSVDPNCQWYNPNQFATVGNVPLGAPRVWVADWKHANYTSYSHCMYGTYGLDRCNWGPRYEVRFPISRDFRLLRGSRVNWSKIPARRGTAPLIDPTKLEDFWAGRTEARFNGWQSNVYGDGGNYGDMLRFFGVYKVVGSQMPGEEECDREAKACP